jgi:hypothetical protein
MREGFESACQDGDVDTVRAYMKDLQYDPSTYNNNAIILSVFHGSANVVQVLLADPRVDPCVNDSWVIRAAASCGYLEIVRMLLNDSRADPSINFDAAIVWATDAEYPAVVKLLLEDRRVNGKRAIKYARGECLAILAANDRFGIPMCRTAYAKYHPVLVELYDRAIAQGYTMAFVAKQLPSWESLAEPLAKRLKAGALF